MMLLATALMVYIGLCLFLFSMPKYTRVLGREYKPTHRGEKIRRLAGWLSLFVGFYLASEALGWVNALVFMFGMTTLAGVCLSLAFQHNPKRALLPVLLVSEGVFKMGALVSSNNKPVTKRKISS
ncbi:DUF3325 domain-containing protein [Pseudoalteromonas sp. S16_S37]|uniref:DUF3325 domain-containing protein n=1 Tax=Pseudoalteromonas sp. S16_S37 TaxID=2720228 RepID=UPI001680864F|nr:DUF3325 domain-containing protein [Pseudoalteromonas sp. S16_S37]MBD1584292.1 DUF3325 domain-containing protein [Pseudoalteromonas sp. S16_S37]